MPASLSLIMTVVLGGALFGAVVLWLYLDEPVVRSGQPRPSGERPDDKASPSDR